MRFSLPNVQIVGDLWGISWEVDVDVSTEANVSVELREFCGTG